MLEKPTRPTVPYLYKYSSADHLDWLESIISKNELYFPTLLELNDPADARPKLTASSLDGFVAFVYNGFVSQNPELQDEDYQRARAEIECGAKNFGTDLLLRKMAGLLHKELEDHRIYSLAERWDNLSMWAKYAGDHKGCCLEFANDGLFTSALEVTYDDGPVTLDVTDSRQNKAYFFFYKSNDWRNEEEARIVCFSNDSPARKKFDPRLLNRIILGKDMVEVQRKKIRDWAKERSPKLEVVRAEYDAFEQKLIINT